MDKSIKNSIISTTSKGPIISSNTPINLFCDPKKVECSLIGMNDSIKICSKVCNCFYQTPSTFSTYDNMSDYIAKTASISELPIFNHSNIIFYLNIGLACEGDLIMLLNNSKNLTTYCRKFNNIWSVLIGGSYKNFIDLFKGCSSDNIIYKSIIKSIYTYSNSAMFEELCDLGILERDKFIDIEPDENFKLLNTIDTEFCINSHLSILNIDSIKKIYNNIHIIDKAFIKSLQLYDIIKLLTLTVSFNNISSSCINIISKYGTVTCSINDKPVFASPDLYNKKYNKKYKYSIKFGKATSSYTKLTLSEIGNSMLTLVDNLCDSTDNALKREDAMSFLPSSLQCSKAYVTFTYDSFLRFLSLEGKEPLPSELENYIHDLGDWFRKSTIFSTKERCMQYANYTKINAYDSLYDDLESYLEVSDDEKHYDPEEYLEKYIKLFIDDLESPKEE